MQKLGESQVKPQVDVCNQCLICTFVLLGENVTLPTMLIGESSNHSIISGKPVYGLGQKEYLILQHQVSFLRFPKNAVAIPQDSLHIVTTETIVLFQHSL